MATINRSKKVVAADPEKRKRDRWLDTVLLRLLRPVRREEILVSSRARKGRNLRSQLSASLVHTTSRKKKRKKEGGATVAYSSDPISPFAVSREGSQGVLKKERKREKARARSSGPLESWYFYCSRWLEYRRYPPRRGEPAPRKKKGERGGGEIAGRAAGSLTFFPDRAMPWTETSRPSRRQERRKRKRKIRARSALNLLTPAARRCHRSRKKKKKGGNHISFSPAGEVWHREKKGGNSGAG